MTQIVRDIRNDYSFVAKVRLAWYVVLTKIFHPEARLIRRPFYQRGAKMQRLGRNLTTGRRCMLEAFVADGDKSVKLTLGDWIRMNDNVHISAIKCVEIGDYVSIAPNVYISDNAHGSYRGDENDTPPTIPPGKRAHFVAPVKIGDRVWLGEGAIVMPGVTIGKGTIIGAHSIVSRDIPANCIAVGSPARVVKRYDEATKRWVKC